MVSDSTLSNAEKLLELSRHLTLYSMSWFIFKRTRFRHRKPQILAENDFNLRNAQLKMQSEVYDPVIAYESVTNFIFAKNSFRCR